MKPPLVLQKINQKTGTIIVVTMQRENFFSVLNLNTFVLNGSLYITHFLLGYTFILIELILIRRFETKLIVRNILEQYYESNLVVKYGHSI